MNAATTKRLIFSQKTAKLHFNRDVLYSLSPRSTTAPCKLLSPPSQDATAIISYVLYPITRDIQELKKSQLATTSDVC